MYTHCIHCHAPLGSNELLEPFPVGRRVAFDGDKGRLWVVCTKCERWNLAPFESRWEAIEQAERAYRGTTVRQSTDNIGLAKCRDGTTLIRVGRPLRPEFAAWRYGDQFGRRRRRAMLMGVGGAVGTALAVTGAMAAGAASLLLVPVMNAVLLYTTDRMRQTPTEIPHPDGGWFLPFGSAKLVAGSADDDDWALSIGYARLLTDAEAAIWRRFKDYPVHAEQGRVTVRGEAARSVLAQLLPRVNSAGAPKSRIDEAVSMLEAAGGPEQMMSWAVRQRQEWIVKQTYGDSGDVAHIPKNARLAIEMSVHEERERLALDGELTELETAWRSAERVAEIADGLLVPAEVQRRLTEMRGEGSSSDLRPERTRFHSPTPE